jgi:putative ABC transport system substrate-binding protein
LTADAAKTRLRAFREGLKANGYVEGQNLKIEFHWVGADYGRLPELAADLAQRHVALIRAAGTPAALAAKAATGTIPIVFNTGDDPVQLGIVASLNQPGGNITGVAFFINQLVSKQIEFLHELAPKAKPIALLTNPTNSQSASQVKNANQAARSLGRQLIIQNASTAQDIEAAFKNLNQLGVGGIIVGADGFFASRRDQVVELAARYTVPAIYSLREFVDAGGLMSYGTDIPETYRQVGIYVGRILKGAQPAQLPVFQSTKFQFVVNRKIAKAQNIQISGDLLSIADEVIE